MTTDLALLSEYFNPRVTYNNIIYYSVTIFECIILLYYIHVVLNIIKQLLTIYLNRYTYINYQKTIKNNIIYYTLLNR